MNLTYETINIFFLLIPGFISTRILDSVVTRNDKDNLGKVIEALVFSFLIYAIANIFYKWEPLIKPKKTEGVYKYILTGDTWLILTILTLSIVVPLIIGAFVHNDLHTKLFRLLKITDKTSRSSVWQDSYINEKRHIVVTLKDERRIYGWPMYYSHNPKESHIYLFQPAWIDADGTYIECDTHGMLIKNEDVDLIEFMKKKDEDLSKVNKE